MVTTTNLSAFLPERLEPAVALAEDAPQELRAFMADARARLERVITTLRG